METVIFNGDFERQLFEGKQNLKSSRMTQEFEYFINWLEPHQTIYTTRDYTKEYQRWFFKFNHEAFKFSADASAIIPWCGTFDQLPLKRKLQDKSSTLAFAAKYELGPQEFSLLERDDLIEPGYLYKYPKSLSGMGHYEYEQKEKIETLLNNGEILTKEKILKRVMDFSTLWKDGKIIAFYQNLITDRYQYRGTLVQKKEDFLGKDQIEAFMDKAPLIETWMEDYRGILSIDSFLFEQEGETRVYFLSEINCRKTMGYTAQELKRKFFPDSKVMKFYFGNYAIPVKDYEKLYKDSAEKVIALSPDDHKFKAFIIAGDSIQEINKLQKLIF